MLGTGIHYTCVHHAEVLFLPYKYNNYPSILFICRKKTFPEVKFLTYKDRKRILVCIHNPLTYRPQVRDVQCAIENSYVM